MTMVCTFGTSPSLGLTIRSCHLQPGSRRTHQELFFSRSATRLSAMDSFARYKMTLMSFMSSSIPRNAGAGSANASCSSWRSNSVNRAASIGASTSKRTMKPPFACMRASEWKSVFFHRFFIFLGMPLAGFQSRSSRLQSGLRAQTKTRCSNRRLISHRGLLKRSDAVQAMLCSAYLMDQRPRPLLVSVQGSLAPPHFVSRRQTSLCRYSQPFAAMPLSNKMGYSSWSKIMRPSRNACWRLALASRWKSFTCEVKFLTRSGQCATQSVGFA